VFLQQADAALRGRRTIVRNSSLTYSRRVSRRARQLASSERLKASGKVSAQLRLHLSPDDVVIQREAAVGDAAEHRLPDGFAVVSSSVSAVSKAKPRRCSICSRRPSRVSMVKSSTWRA
jgi:hypothetical protein